MGGLKKLCNQNVSNNKLLTNSSDKAIETSMETTVQKTSVNVDARSLDVSVCQKLHAPCARWYRDSGDVGK